MSFASYTSFGNSVASWLLDDNNATMTSVGVSMMTDLITVAETRLFREVRTIDMETALSLSITAGMAATPADYVDTKFSYVTTSPAQFLERRNVEWIYENYPNRGAEGIPKFFARQGTNFIFGPYPDSTYTINGVYYKRLTAISGAALNALFTNNPDLYLFATLAEGVMVIGQDPRLQVWEAKYKNILMQVNGQDTKEAGSGSSLQMRVNGVGGMRMR